MSIISPISENHWSSSLFNDHFDWFEHKSVFGGFCLFVCFTTAEEQARSRECKGLGKIKANQLNSKFVQANVLDARTKMQRTLCLQLNHWQNPGPQERNHGFCLVLLAGFVVDCLSCYPYFSQQQWKSQLPFLVPRRKTERSSSKVYKQPKSSKPVDIW